MAHEIDMSNKRANIAFVGSKPWHGLGQELTYGASIETWKKEAGMNWTIRSSPVIYSPESADGQENKIVVPNKFANKRVLYRNDTEAPLSVVSNSYKVVQPGEILEFFRDLVSIDDMKLETAGCLFGGQRYWALANTGRETDIIKNDRVKGMLLLTTSCDGTLATTAKFTSVRVVCNNTLRIAMSSESDSSSPSIRIGHNSIFNPQSIKEALGLMDAGWDKFINEIRLMSNTKVSDNVVKKFFADIILTKEQMEIFAKEEKDLHGRVQAKLDKMFNMYKGQGMGSSLVTGSLWGALNAVTEFADHSVGNKPDNMLWNSWFGYSENLKNKAFEKAKELV